MTDTAKRGTLERPAEDYLTGFEKDGKWIPGLIDVVSQLQKRQNYAIWGLLLLWGGHFFGIDTVSDILKVISH